ncbi:hypothetical protein T01_1081 [Trichinella spiralis]|uniref:Uncharacterized protein n=1 Tax=Trichinella spiralis TaxID=6334 RepID=A0A0V0YWQ3_TRISP|nr:hypothetical protein T01_1081 [Trichinella spiralis]
MPDSFKKEVVINQFTASNASASDGGRQVITRLLLNLLPEKENLGD